MLVREWSSSNCARLGGITSDWREERIKLDRAAARGREAKVSISSTRRCIRAGEHRPQDSCASELVESLAGKNGLMLQFAGVVWSLILIFRQPGS